MQDIISTSELITSEINFIQHKKQMKSWFLKRGYPVALIQNEMDKVKFKRQRIQRRKGITKGVPLVIPRCT